MSQTSQTEPASHRITHLPALRLAGLSRRYPATPEAMREIGKQWQDFAHGAGGKLLASGPVMYGVHIGLFGNGGEDEYFTGVAIGAGDPLPASLTERHLPAITCAVIDHAGHASQISQTTGKLMRELSGSGPRLAQKRPFDLIERYGKGFDPQTASGDIQLIVPVEE